MQKWFSDEDDNCKKNMLVLLLSPLWLLLSTPVSQSSNLLGSLSLMDFLGTLLVILLKGLQVTPPEHPHHPTWWPTWWPPDHPLRLNCPRSLTHCSLWAGGAGHMTSSLKHWWHHHQWVEKHFQHLLGSLTLIRTQAIPSWSAAMDAKVVKAGWQGPVYRTVYCKSNDYVAGPCA